MNAIVISPRCIPGQVRCPSVRVIELFTSILLLYGGSRGHILLPHLPRSGCARSCPTQVVQVQVREKLLSLVSKIILKNSFWCMCLQKPFNAFFKVCIYTFVIVTLYLGTQFGVVLYSLHVLAPLIPETIEQVDKESKYQNAVFPKKYYVTFYQHMNLSPCPADYE